MNTQSKKKSPINPEWRKGFQAAKKLFNNLPLNSIRPYYFNSIKTKITIENKV